MALVNGAKLGPYEILSLIAAGGMGEVYRARDTRLDRIVALKVSRGEFGERFEREGRAVAALNHPQICALYDVGPNYLVMEFVQGETLAESLQNGPLSTDVALQYAAQIAQALAAAHRQGIIHRDLKPGNIMVRPDGTVKVLDFGLARFSQPVCAGSSDPAEAPTQTQTQPGTILGTPAYMSPEQARGAAVGAASDFWSLGIVLYEMFTGTRPFRGNSHAELMAEILFRDPTPVRSLNRRVPREVASLIHSMLVKDPERRCGNATEVARILQECASSVVPNFHGSKRALVLTGAFVLLAILVPGALIYRSSQRAWARYQALPQVQTLVNKGDLTGAYELLHDAARIIPDEPTVKRLWPEVTRILTVRSNPAGAEVFWKPYAALNTPWQVLGRTPVERATLPAGPIRVRLAAAGYEAAEFAAPAKELQFDFKRVATLPAGMVLVSAGSLNERIAGIGLLNVPHLKEFALDRYEVTNRQFKEFIDRGGYDRREYWKAPFQEQGRRLAWEQAMTRFRDPTGRPGPSTWEAGTYSAGQDNYPVSGVSWYEAAAYAEFVGGRLPSVYEWVRAANIRGGEQNESWFIAPLSNFSSSGTKAVGQSGAVGSFGAYDLAGNVREWCREEAQARRYILGGSWAEDSYMLARGQTASPFDRSSTNGFRCARDTDASRTEQALPAIVPDSRPDYDRMRAVSDDVFALYSHIYAYEKRQLQPVVQSSDDGADLWRREKVGFQAPYGNEQIVAYLFLPKQGKPPYQCVLFMGAADILQAGSGEKIQPIRYVLQSGRAMLYPIYKYALDRYSKLAADPVAQRDAIVTWRKDLGASIDYLETRKDINVTKLAHIGGSLGSAVSPMLLFSENRIKVAILLSAGLRPLGLLPEADPVNFLPRMKIPTLMVTGRYDTILPIKIAQEPMFRKLGALTKDKRHVILPTGHAVQGPEVRNQLVGEVLDWLDRHLGKP